MKRKQLIQNITISIIIGIILGSITEFALILDISWLIKITQSLMFWGIVMCICVLISKNYSLSLINSILVITLMNATYYIIRLIKSGYTDIDAWKLYTLTGIAGSMYIGNIISLIKVYCHKQNNTFLKYNFIFMTISGLLFAIYGWYNVWISHNLFYSLDLGIIIGFAIIILVVFLCGVVFFYKDKKSDKTESSDKYSVILDKEGNIIYDRE